MKRIFALLVIIGLILGVKETDAAKANPNPPDIVVGSLDDTGWCDPGGIDCAYVPLPPIEIEL